jgi:hypothetical protein
MEAGLLRTWPAVMRGYGTNTSPHGVHVPSTFTKCQFAIWKHHVYYLLACMYTLSPFHHHDNCKHGCFHVPIPLHSMLDMLICVMGTSAHTLCHINIQPFNSLGWIDIEG